MKSENFSVMKLIFNNICVTLKLLKGAVIMEKSKNILDYISVDDIKECLSQLGLYKHISDKKKFVVDDKRKTNSSHWGVALYDGDVLDKDSFVCSITIQDNIIISVKMNEKKFSESSRDSLEFYFIDFIVKKLGADFVEKHLNNYIALYRNYLSKSYFPQNENLELIKNHASRLDPISKKKILKHIKTSQDSYDKIIDIMCEPLEYNFKRCISRNKNLKIMQ